MFVGTTLKNVAEGIDVYAHEEVGRTSMYDILARKSVRAYAGSFKFDQCERSQLPSLVEQHRAKYQRVIICATLNSAWRLGESLQQPKVNEEEEMFHYGQIEKEYTLIENIYVGRRC